MLIWQSSSLQFKIQKKKKRLQVFIHIALRLCIYICVYLIMLRPCAFALGRKKNEINYILRIFRKPVVSCNNTPTPISQSESNPNPNPNPPKNPRLYFHGSPRLRLDYWAIQMDALGHNQTEKGGEGSRAERDAVDSKCSFYFPYV